MPSNRGEGLALVEALQVLSDAGKADDAIGVASLAREVAERIGVPDIGADRYGPWLRLDVAGVGFRMRYCPPGRYLRGSPPDENGRFVWEPAPHEVVLTRGFWLGETPVHQALWRAVTGVAANDVEDLGRPVDAVRWKECRHFADLLEKKLAAGVRLHFRLPTDAEWEYACRAGTTGARYGDLDAIAWFVDNARHQSQSVGRKAPNPWGLYDMLGNVWEWCADGVDSPRREGTPQTDPMTTGRYRIRRGGSWSVPARYVRAACYFVMSPSVQAGQLGFRLAADLAT